MLVLLQKELQSAEKGEDKLDWSTATHHRTNERGGERGHRAAQDTENTGTNISEEVNKHPLLKLLQPKKPFSHFLPLGGNNPDHEDEEAHQQRPAADGAGGDPEEYVFTAEEDDQGAD